MATIEPESDSTDGSERIGEHVRIFQRGKTWYANFQFNRQQHRQSLKTSNKKEARRRAAQIDVQLTVGLWKPAIEAVTIAKAVEDYLTMLTGIGRAPKTLSKYRNVLGKVDGLAAQRRIKDLDGLNLQFLDAYQKMRTDQNAAPKTKYNECVIMRQLLIFAVSRSMLAVDPMKGAKLKKPKPTVQPCWTKEQVQVILQAAPPELLPALTLLAETGMRYGELAWLTWKDVDFQANVLWIRPKDGWKPKSGDQRAIPLSDTARTVLEGLSRHADWVVTMPPTAKNPDCCRRWTERRLLDGLKCVLKKVDLIGKLHTFRHSFISHALLRGTPVAVVKQWVGHVDPKIIEHYTHVHDAASQAAMKKLSDKDNPQGKAKS